MDIPTGKQLGATAPRDNRRLRVITTMEARAILTPWRSVTCKPGG